MKRSSSQNPDSKQQEGSSRRISNIPLSLGKPSLRTRLEAYYELIAPETIANKTEWRSKFEQIYQKYGGSYEGEKKLASKLAKKYGVAVRLMVATPKAEGGTQKNSNQANAQVKNKHEEEWYHLRPAESNSGDIKFVSRQFDPFAALTCPEIDILRTNPWVSECSLLDTVAQFAFHLPREDPQRRDPATLKRAPSAKASEAPNKKTKQLHPFDSIANSFESGPLSTLKKFHKNRVKVVVRYVNAIRGTITGTLCAFDKHFNMILRDVIEDYSPRPVDDDSKTNAERERDRRRMVSSQAESKDSSSWSVRQREMKQILVRGDIVVSVYLADAARKVSAIESKENFITSAHEQSAQKKT